MKLPEPLTPEEREELDRAHARGETRGICIDVAPPGSFPGYGYAEAEAAAGRMLLRIIRSRQTGGHRDESSGA